MENNIHKIILGKLIGLSIALVYVILANIIIDEEISLRLQVGIMLWYTTFGAIIILARIVFDNDLLITVKFPYGSIFIGSWLNFVILMVSYEELQQIILSLFILNKSSIFSSPLLFVLEGVIIGVVIDYLVARINSSNLR